MRTVITGYDDYDRYAEGPEFPIVSLKAIEHIPLFTLREREERPEPDGVRNVPRPFPLDGEPQIMRTPMLLTLALGMALSACSEKTQDAASDTASSAASDVATTASDVTDKASAGADAVGDAASKAVDNAAAAADNAADKVGAAADKMGTRIKQGASEAKDTLNNTPTATPTPQ